MKLKNQLTLKKLSLRQGFGATEAKLILLLEQLTDSTKYTTALTSDYKLIMPHHDHYLTIEDFDGLYGVEGYTTDKIFSTIKYMIQNPHPRPNDALDREVQQKSPKKILIRLKKVSLSLKPVTNLVKQSKIK